MERCTGPSGAAVGAGALLVGGLQPGLRREASTGHYPQWFDDPPGTAVVDHAAMPFPGSRAVIHLLLHALVPLAVARGWWPRQWARTWALLLVGWLIDIDHLLATPIYAPGRCSLEVHPLHSPAAILVYVALLAPRKTRVAAIGLLIHIALDAIDCVFMR